MEGVALLHKAGLIHRGICPDNILLPIDGAARLTGYGTLALRTAGSELKKPALPPAMRHRNSIQRRNSLDGTPMCTLWRRSLTDW